MNVFILNSTIKCIIKISHIKVCKLKQIAFKNLNPSEKESKDLTHSRQIVIKFPDGRLGTENFKINNY